MKIKVNQIPLEGFTLEENIPSAELELEEELIKFHEPVSVKADIFRITNAVTIDLVLISMMSLNCGRCLNEFEVNLRKSLELNYQTNSLEPIIDLNPEIRQEIILDYPIKPLCRPDCKGLCSKCGKNLNEGGCCCGTTEKKTF